jgi:hypothetical protein
MKSALAVKAGGKREDIATWEEKGTRDMVYRGLPGALSRGFIAVGYWTDLKRVSSQESGQPQDGRGGPWAPYA